MSVNLIREAAEVLRDPYGRDPADINQLAADLLDLISGSELLLGLTTQEARAIMHSANIMGTAYEEILRDAGRELPEHVSPLVTVAMRLETLLMTEQIEP